MGCLNGLSRCLECVGLKEPGPGIHTELMEAETNEQRWYHFCLQSAPSSEEMKGWFKTLMVSRLAIIFLGVCVSAGALIYGANSKDWPIAGITLLGTAVILSTCYMGTCVYRYFKNSRGTSLKQQLGILPLYGSTQVDGQVIYTY